MASRGSWRAWEAAQSGACTYGLQTCVPGRRLLALCGPEGRLLPSRAAGSPDFKGDQGRSKKDYCSEVLWDGLGSEGELASLLSKAPAKWPSVWGHWVSEELVLRPLPKGRSAALGKGLLGEYGLGPGCSRPRLQLSGSSGPPSLACCTASPSSHDCLPGTSLPSHPPSH